MRMYVQHPIFGVIIAAFIIVLVITESILKERVLKNRLTFSFMNLALFIILIFFYDDFIYPNDANLTPYVIYIYFTYGVFLLALYQTFRNAIINGSYYQLFIKGVKNTKWNVYYVVDHKERIKDISLSLLRELNLEKEEVIGKKFMTTFTAKVRFTKLNGEDIHNRTIEKYFNEYKKQVKPNDSEIMELHFQNYNGETVILHLNMQPLYVLGRYRGRMAVGEKRTDEELLAVEKELKETDLELESIRHKFIATLELSEEGLFSIDLDEKNIWLNNILLEQLNIPAHTLKLNDFRSFIHQEDLQKYLDVISNLTPMKPTYAMTYRFKVEETYIWVKEKGKRLFEDKSVSTVMGIMTPMHTQYYRKTQIDILDQIKDENYLLPDLKQLIKNERPFQLALITLKNVPQINEAHGRDVGNMVMAQYIAKLKQSFITESSDIYRISGLEFAFTITDPRKMSMLHAGLRSDEHYLNMAVDYGAISTELHVFVGIATMHEDAVNAQDLYQNAAQALKTAQLPQYKGQGCYFKDIK